MPIAWESKLRPCENTFGCLIRWDLGHSTAQIRQSAGAVAGAASSGVCETKKAVKVPEKISGPGALWTFFGPVRLACVPNQDAPIPVMGESPGRFGAKPACAAPIPGEACRLQPPEKAPCPPNPS
jgi:hypothetical protein